MSILTNKQWSIVTSVVFIGCMIGFMVSYNANDLKGIIGFAFTSIINLIISVSNEILHKINEGNKR